MTGSHAESVPSGQEPPRQGAARWKPNSGQAPLAVECREIRARRGSSIEYLLRSAQALAGADWRLPADPLGAVANIYARFGYDYTAEFERSMKDYLGRTPDAMRSNHRYGLDAFCLARPGLIDRCAAHLSWPQDRTGLCLAG